MKLLHLDIETAPNVAHVWGLWQQNVSIKQLLNSGYTMSWAAKWHKKRKVHFDSLHHSSPEDMIRGIWELLDECDAAVHYNGARFDIPTLNKEFLLHDFPPPSPYEQIDLLQTARKVFKFPSNKLDYLLQALGHKGKVNHIGHELWIRCMNGDPAAWKQMERYNRGDVTELEKLYISLLPWITKHPNMGLYVDAESPVCPRCGSQSLQRRGIERKATQTYQRFRCNSCGSWSRSRQNCTQNKENVLAQIG